MLEGTPAQVVRAPVLWTFLLLSGTHFVGGHHSFTPFSRSVTAFGACSFLFRLTAQVVSLFVVAVLCCTLWLLSESHSNRLICSRTYFLVPSCSSCAPAHSLAPLSSRHIVVVSCDSGLLLTLSLSSWSFCAVRPPAKPTQQRERADRRELQTFSYDCSSLTLFHCQTLLFVFIVCLVAISSLSSLTLTRLIFSLSTSVQALI